MLFLTATYVIVNSGLKLDKLSNYIFIQNTDMFIMRFIISYTTTTNAFELGKCLFLLIKL